MEKTAWIRTIQEQVRRLSESPLYQKRFQTIGLNPGDIRSLEDFQKIPLMDTKDLQKDLEENPPHGSLFHPETVRVTLSPGPKGLMPVYHTRQDVEEVNRELAVMYRACGVGPHDIAAVTFGYHLFIAGIIPGLALGFSLMATIYILAVSGVERCPLRARQSLQQIWQSFNNASLSLSVSDTIGTIQIRGR